MMDEQNQALLDRMQQLEQALERAEAGCATPDDWHHIRFECGVWHHPKPKTKEKNESYSEI
jgi:hypothetical protein